MFYDGDEVDPRHRAVGCPLVVPVVHGEILYGQAFVNAEEDSR